MMGDDRCAGHEEAALSRAAQEELRHFLAVLHDESGAEQDVERAQANLREAAAAMFGAGIGEARRLVRERGERVGAEIRRLAGVAEAIERRLPHRLYLTWRTHFVDGLALSEYARVAGVDETAARADYRELVGALVNLVVARGVSRVLERMGSPPNVARGPRGVIFVTLFTPAAAVMPSLAASSRITAFCEGVYSFATRGRSVRRALPALAGDASAGAAAALPLRFTPAAFAQVLTQLSGTPCLRAASRTPIAGTSFTAASRSASVYFRRFAGSLLARFDIPASIRERRAGSRPAFHALMRMADGRQEHLPAAQPSVDRGTPLAASRRTPPRT